MFFYLHLYPVGRRTYTIGSFRAALFANCDETLSTQLRQLSSIRSVERNQLFTTTGSQPNPPSWGLRRVSQRFSDKSDDVFRYPAQAHFH